MITRTAGTKGDALPRQLKVLPQLSERALGNPTSRRNYKDRAGAITAVNVDRHLAEDEFQESKTTSRLAMRDTLPPPTAAPSTYTEVVSATWTVSHAAHYVDASAPAMPDTLPPKAAPTSVERLLQDPAADSWNEALMLGPAARRKSTFIQVNESKRQYVWLGWIGVTNVLIGLIFLSSGLISYFLGCRKDTHSDSKDDQRSLAAQKAGLSQNGDVRVEYAGEELNDGDQKWILRAGCHCKRSLGTSIDAAALNLRLFSLSLVLSRCLWNVHLHSVVRPVLTRSPTTHLITRLLSAQSLIVRCCSAT